MSHTLGFFLGYESYLCIICEVYLLIPHTFYSKRFVVCPTWGLVVRKVIGPRVSRVITRGVKGFLSGVIKTG